MSITAVLPFFRARLDSLDYTEHEDALNFENIPQTILNEKYHLEVGPILSGPANQLDHDFEYPVTVRVFLRGFVDTNSLRDDAISRAELILEEILKPSNRLGTTIKDVVPNNVEILPIAASNDNDMILQLDFTSIIKCKFE
jgi:hypothetical protein